jgi:hypothetical protein
LTNSAWRILADFYIRSGGFEKNHLATLLFLSVLDAEDDKLKKLKKNAIFSQLVMDEGDEGNEASTSAVVATLSERRRRSKYRLKRRIQARKSLFAVKCAKCKCKKEHLARPLLSPTRTAFSLLKSIRCSDNGRFSFYCSVPHVHGTVLWPQPEHLTRGGLGLHAQLHPVQPGRTDKAQCGSQG